MAKVKTGIIMKFPQNISCCLAIVIAGWGSALTVRAVTTADFSRYQVVLDRKPFGEVAPIVLPGAADLATAESFAKDYEMKAIIDDGEKLRVCILDKKTTKHVYLDIGQEIGGIQLVAVNYDKEEASLKMGDETMVIKLHPDKDNAAAPAGALGAPAFGLPRKSMSTEAVASPFGVTDQSGNRRPFFSDLRRRGASPFQRMGTNTPKSLESFFKPNTNMTTPFVSPFRPQASPFKSVAAGQENPNAAAQTVMPAAAGQSLVPPGMLSPQAPVNPNQTDVQAPVQTPMQPVATPFIESIDANEVDESEE